MENLLNPSEVAIKLNMSKVWVYKACERGLLPFFRIGDAIRFDPQQIDAYIESRKGLKRSEHLVGEQEGVRKP